MAVDLPGRTRGLPAASGPAVVAGAKRSVFTPVRESRGHEPKDWPKAAIRVLEVVPGALALFLISALIWGYVWFPLEAAIALVFFDIYWFWKSWTIAFHVLKGTRLIVRDEGRDWLREHQRAYVKDPRGIIAWAEVKHVVIIPNYKEGEEKLRQTLRRMAECDGARQSIIPVLAMEAIEAAAEAKAAVLEAEFAPQFFDFYVTFHPGNLPGEVRGKSSNQAWAARCVVDALLDRGDIDIDNLTVTSCDADTLFHPRYFSALTYHFATDPMRYRRFWQAPIFFYNNIWQVPAPLRVPNALSGLIHLSRLSRRRKVLFSQSTYTLSMRMAHDIGYWDVDIIPEDWHMFLKCYYRLQGTVEVQPIHLPLGNDGALSHTTRETYINQYLQVRRWAWGATDVPFIVQEMFKRDDVPWRKRLLRFWYFFENHIAWSTQWFFITLGGLLPWVYDRATGVELVPEWFYIDILVKSTVLPDWIAAIAPSWLTITSVILTPCMVFYVILITMDARLRPPAPASFTKVRHALGLLQWLAIPPITFFFSCLPALDSQVRLMIGKRMEYRVTEKV